MNTEKRPEMIAQFLKEAMSRTEGRAMFSWILEISRAYPGASNPFAATPEATAFNCGEMSIGQMLLHEILTHAPDDYIIMLKENSNG